MNETIQLLVAVHEAIGVLADCRGQYGDDWLLAQGLDAGLALDENFIANYEHLLLRLQTDLIEALARKALEELLCGDHDKRQRKLLAWFTEFAEKPQALSTFPWTIKPSLAVLWGVCWMFYDRESDTGKARVPLDTVLQNIHLAWDSGASSDCRCCNSPCRLRRCFEADEWMRLAEGCQCPRRFVVGRSGWMLTHCRRRLRPTADWRAAAACDACDKRACGP